MVETTIPSGPQSVQPASTDRRETSWRGGAVDLHDEDTAGIVDGHELNRRPETSWPRSPRGTVRRPRLGPGCPQSAPPDGIVKSAPESVENDDRRSIGRPVGAVAAGPPRRSGRSLRSTGRSPRAAPSPRPARDRRPPATPSGATDSLRRRDRQITDRPRIRSVGVANHQLGGATERSVPEVGELALGLRSVGAWMPTRRPARPPSASVRCGRASRRSSTAPTARTPTRTPVTAITLATAMPTRLRRRAARTTWSRRSSGVGAPAASRSSSSRSLVGHGTHSPSSARRVSSPRWMCERTVACRHPSTWAVTSSGTSSKNRSTIAARCLNGRRCQRQPQALGGGDVADLDEARPARPCDARGSRAPP